MVSNNYLDRHELLKEARIAHDLFCIWRIENNVEPGAQYVRRIMRGAIPPPPPISDAFYIMLWRMGKGLISGPSFNGYSDDWKDEFQTVLAEALIHFHGKFNYKDVKFKNLTEDEMAKGCFAFFTKCIKRTFYMALNKLKIKSEAEKEMVAKADYDHWHTPHYENVEDAIIRKADLIEAGLDENGDREGDKEIALIKARVGIKKFRGNHCLECGIRIMACSKKKIHCDKCTVVVLRNKRKIYTREKRRRAKMQKDLNKS